MNNPTEAQIQRSFFEYARMKYPDVLVFSVPNDGISGPKGKFYGQRRKSLGLVSGIPDILVAHPGKLDKKGLFIELKAKKGVLSSNQKECLKYLSKFYETRVCYSVDSAINELDEYLGHGRSISTHQISQ